MLQDLRYTLRAIVKRPSFAIGTMLVLGLAVGVNTAVFSLLNLLLLRPLPVPAPNRLAFIYHGDAQSVGVSYGEYRDLQASTSDVFTNMAARGGDGGGRLRTGNDAVPLRGENVTPNYFDVVGVAPALGRGFRDDENSSGASPVAVISDALWKSHFASDPDILGRTLRIDAGSLSSAMYSAWRDYTIVGVMPPSFTGTGSAWQPARYWLLIEQRFADMRAARPETKLRLDQRPVVPIGRLKPGVTLAQARSAVESAAIDILSRSADRQRLGQMFRTLAAPRATLPFQGAYIIDIPRVTATLAAVGTILLFIAGVNLAGMLLARGMSRRTEIAVRLSLGIGRVRLVRHLLVESVVVALAAGAVGLLIARLALAAALHGFPSQIPGSSGVALSIEVPIDARVLAFAFASGLTTALLVGLVPAWQALRIDLLAALAGASSTTGRSRSRLRRLILIPQIALALVLLLVTGVFVRHLLRTELANPGFDPRRVVTLDIQLPQRPVETLAGREHREAFLILQKRIVARLASLPGVTAVSAMGGMFDGVPLAASSTTIIARSDYETTRQYRGVREGFVSKDYFDALGIPLLRGRVFDERDAADGSMSVIVSERFANDVWPGKDPIGEQIAMHAPGSRYPIRWRTVVGVVGSVTQPTAEYPWPVFYSPVERHGLMGTTFVLKGDGNPARIAADAKEAVRAVDPSVLVVQVRAVEDTVSALRYPRRFTAAIVGASGSAALLLAAIGVFALMSYAVAQRRAEIGVRMVLGAGRRDITRLILRDGAAVVVAGIALGFALAFAAIRYASHTIVPLPDADAATFVAVPLVLTIVVLCACYVPARRAARVDPLVVLRKS